MDSGTGMALLIAVAALASVLACFLAWRQHALIEKVDALTKVLRRLNERSDTDLKTLLGRFEKTQEGLDRIVGRIEHLEARSDSDNAKLRKLIAKPQNSANAPEGAHHRALEPAGQPSPSTGLHLIAPAALPDAYSTGNGSGPRILIALAHPGFLRNFAQTVEELAQHACVHLHFAKSHRNISLDDYRIRVRPGQAVTCSVGQAKVEQDDAETVRLLRDILTYARPEFRAAENLYQRFVSLQKGGERLHGMIALLQQAALDLPPEARDRAAEWLSRRESLLAPLAEAQRVVDDLRPDLVVVSPYVNFGSREVDVVKAAKAQGVPTVLAVASWDNLTNKGVIKVQPDYVAVWNRHMAAEAVDLHNVPPERIWVTGATVFDPWFECRPTKDRDAFCQALGLDPRQLILTYVCSSESIAGAHEDQIIRQWLDGLSKAELDKLRAANVLIRPHPMNLDCWKAASKGASGDTLRFERAVVWPASPKHPTTEEGRAVFYDTLFHADAIIGLNTSVMIEAAILRKPVLTFRGHAAEGSQTGNQHFKYLAASGPVIEAGNLADHVEQLSRLMSSGGAHERLCEEFVADFVRPLGLETNASAMLARRILGILDKKYLEAAQ